ncbi:MAG: autotransporter outer membrane beta-barrel domain-containing protein [Alphaproteobacteria bacterium]|nr:autotransporter outer membrane beta-barrel domain-containing protein [Alphaproteobacteria bacterium]
MNFNAAFSCTNGSGGRFCINGGTFSISGGDKFENRHTDERGGAIYLSSGTITIQTANDDTTIFKENSDSTGLNDIALFSLFGSGDSHLNINGNSGQVIFYGGISNVGDNNSYINKSGNGELVLQSSSINNNFNGTFTQTGGVTRVYTTNFFAGRNVISGGTIHFYDTLSINNLSISGGANIDLRSISGQYNTLTVENWTANGGNIFLNTYFDDKGNKSDKLVLTGSATGNATLFITPTGFSETRTPKDANGILVVDLTDAIVKTSKFSLAGKVIDVGALEYGLVQGSDDNWYLTTNMSPDPSNNTAQLTNTAKTIANVPAMHLYIVKSGMNELRKRLGNLRSENKEKQAGLWIRSYGKYLNVNDTISTRIGLVGTESGIDISRKLHNSELYVGIMGGIMYSDSVKIKQTNKFYGSGDASIPNIGTYATWMHKSGWFVDATFRNFWVETNLNNVSSSGHDIEHRAMRNFISTSVESGRSMWHYAPSFAQFGKREISLIMWEPKVEARYSLGLGSSHKTSFGDVITFDDTHSFDTRLALQATYLVEGTDSVWRPFIEAGIYNEWLGNTKMNFAGVYMDSDIGGAGFDISIGTNVRMTQSSYAYGDFTLEFGNAYESYALNIGMRIKF